MSAPRLQPEENSPLRNAPAGRPNGPDLNGEQVRLGGQVQRGTAELAVSRKTGLGGAIYWRVEGSLVDLTAVRQVAYFTWNAHTFVGRWARRSLLAATAITRPLFYFTNKRLATRTLDALLRGVTRDRLDLLGEEYFQYVIKPQLKHKGVEKLRECMDADNQVILVSHGLDHVICPLARYLGVERVIANRLEFRDGLATGRVLDPVVPPRGAFALVFGGAPDGRVRPEKLMRKLKIKGGPEQLEAAARPAERPRHEDVIPVVLTDEKKPAAQLSVRETLHGKHVLLVGVTGFIGKVWLEQILTEVPDIGKIYLLIRRQKSTTAARRFEKIAEESPVFEPLHQEYGDGIGRFLAERVEVVEGDVSRPDLGMDQATRKRLAARLDLVVNSSGLTDFNPDLREALAGNVGAPMNILGFLRECDHAATGERANA